MAHIFLKVQAAASVYDTDSCLRSNVRENVNTEMEGIGNKYLA